MHVTTDVVITDRASKVIFDALGIAHYAVIVEEIPQHVKHVGPKPPFLVKMCDLCDAYEAATGWYDFVYPTWYLTPDQEVDGVPTCVRCSGV